MLTDRQDAQIREPVVLPVAIDVIDVLPRFEAPTEMLFHEVTMEKHALPVYGDSDVATFGGFDAHRFGVANLRTVPAKASSARWQREVQSAALADFHLSGIVVGPSPPEGLQASLFVDFRQTETTPRTEPHVVLLQSIWADKKRLSALLASHGDGHPSSYQKQAIAIALDTARRSKGKK